MEANDINPEYVAARATGTSPAALTRLSNSGDYMTRMIVAANNATPLETVSGLTVDVHSGVRRVASTHPALTAYAAHHNISVALAMVALINDFDKAMLDSYRDAPEEWLDVLLVPNQY